MVQQEAIRRMATHATGQEADSNHEGTQGNRFGNTVPLRVIDADFL
jgi:hypothetical protein